MDIEHLCRLSVKALVVKNVSEHANIVNRTPFVAKHHITGWNTSNWNLACPEPITTKGKYIKTHRADDLDHLPPFFDTWWDPLLF